MGELQPFINYPDDSDILSLVLVCKQFRDVFANRKKIVVEKMLFPRIAMIIVGTSRFECTSFVSCWVENGKVIVNVNFKFLARSVDSTEFSVELPVFCKRRRPIHRKVLTDFYVYSKLNHLLKKLVHISIIGNVLNFSWKSFNFRKQQFFITKLDCQIYYRSIALPRTTLH